MNTKTCKRCGWVYPITQPGTKCKICGEPFEQIVCRICGQVKNRNEMMKSTLCKKCHSRLIIPYGKGNYRRRIGRLEDSLNAWLDKVAKVPKSYATLTEEQWLEACRFFNGCARCYSEDIDTRGFFIPARLGGRYCDWNVIPLCERCAKTWDRTNNVFITATFRDEQNRNSEYRDQLKKIVEYLEVKLDVAIRDDTDAAESTEGSE